MHINFEEIINRQIQYIRKKILKAKEDANKNDMYFYIGAEKAWIDIFNDLNLSNQNFERKYIEKYTIILIDYFYIAKYYYYRESLIDGYSHTISKVFDIISPDSIDEINYYDNKMYPCDRDYKNQQMANGYINEDHMFIRFEENEKRDHEKMFHRFIENTYVDLLNIFSKTSIEDMYIKREDIESGEQ